MCVSACDVHVYVCICVCVQCMGKCVCVYVCMYVCMYVCIHVYLGVYSCEFMGWVACCSVSNMFGEIRTRYERFGVVLDMDPIY